MTAAEQYVAAAYLVIVVLVLAWVLIIATKLQRLERALDEAFVARDAGRDEQAREDPPWSAASEWQQHGAAEVEMR